MMNRITIIVLLGTAGCGAGRVDPARTHGEATAASEPESELKAEPQLNEDPQTAPSGDLTDNGNKEAASALVQADTDVDKIDDAATIAPSGLPSRPLAATEIDSLLKITIVNDKGEVIPGVIVTVENSKGKKFISRESDENGFLELLVPKGDTYTARFVSLSENEVTKQIPMPDKPFITAEFQLIHTPSKTKSFVLNGVVFDTNKWDLKPESYPNLENLLEYMSLKKSAHIRLEGHTDNVGDDRANRVLSQKRAEAVRKYLIKKGIAPARMQAAGYGESQPVASNDTEEGRQTNRRTVVTILSK